MPPLRMRLPLESSPGNTPQYPINFRALSKSDVMLPNSTTIVIAEMCASIVQLYYIRLGVFFWLPGYLLAAHPWRDDRTQPAFLPAVAGQALLEAETLRPLVPLKVTNPERDNVSHPVRSQSL